MILFTQKMYALTKMRVTSIKYLLNPPKNGPEFNEQQKQLLRTTTKFVTLLSFAMVSTWIYFVETVIEFGIMGDLRFLNGTVGNIDCIINIICLLLQYKINQRYYKKCCKMLCELLYIFI